MTSRFPNADVSPSKNVTESRSDIDIPAPSMDPRNFCEVQSPAKVKLGIGVSWDGLYLFLPGIAA